jgi:hypothetical protein
MDTSPIDNNQGSSPESNQNHQPLTVLEYSIDDKNIFKSIEPQTWMEFALANNTPELTPDSVRGKMIWDYINGGDSRQIYNTLFKRIRREKQTIKFPYRCDSADIRRFMTMEMRPGENNSIAFKSSVMKIEKRTPISLLDIASSRTEDIIIICSWCKDIWVYDIGWINIEEGVRRLGIFDSIAQPRLTHSVCVNCQKLLDTKLP